MVRGLMGLKKGMRWKLCAGEVRQIESDIFLMVDFCGKHGPWDLMVENSEWKHFLSFSC